MRGAASVARLLPATLAGAPARPLPLPARSVDPPTSFCCSPLPNKQVVLNYSFPLTTEDYVHRIGRTGRAGKTGAQCMGATGSGCVAGLHVQGGARVHARGWCSCARENPRQLGLQLEHVPAWHCFLPVANWACHPQPDLPLLCRSAGNVPE